MPSRNACAATRRIVRTPEVRGQVAARRATISYLKMQVVMRMVIQKVMSENHIDAFVNPEQTTPPYKLGGPGEPEVNNRTQRVAAWDSLH